MTRVTGKSALADLCRLEQELPDLGDHGAWMAGAIGEFLTGGAPTLGHALGISQRGGIHIAAEYRYSCRNALLREYAAQFLANMPARQRPAALAREICRFEIRQWPRLAARSVCPGELVGTREGMLFDLLKIGGMKRNGKPISAAQIRRIIR